MKKKEAVMKQMTDNDLMTSNEVDEGRNEEQDQSRMQDDEWTRVRGSKNTTRAGKTINRPIQYIEEINAVAVKNYWAQLKFYEKHDQEEFAMVGAGIGGGFGSTTELHVMKYKQAMHTKDKEHWI